MALIFCLLIFLLVFYLTKVLKIIESRKQFTDF